MLFPISLVLSYLIGTVSGSYFLGKIFLNVDVREHGSKNAGTTNAMRVLGKKLGVITFIIDFLKGVLVAFISKFLFDFSDEYTLLIILACIIGHDYPFYMKFKGGKGVATTLGAFAVFDFKLTFICWIVWMLLTIFTRIVSLASIGFFLSIFVLFTFFGFYSIYSKILIGIICILGIYRHKSNILRLLSGTENKIGNRR
ncbi:glycerol-3-phosphate 1-O-acyltransferase PlsY [Anaerosphaera multitolerans]|uniref:Glycerol-3-phosphate acyltransferase n=1 Tax=Anaerosphaera multitolerans TaxID=2487351 RepID=A0A437S7X2_9FIRM|nr:glycerol-3-phosphate 1-O-acyltransferase PlsY [Anaerosphaera multitolerans]RVU55173.1 glycerol-3-phosphate 1-O-acyltransferase [Anaerosphaera multitolerans]